jgi:hypothetical protein
VEKEIQTASSPACCWKGQRTRGIVDAWTSCVTEVTEGVELGLSSVICQLQRQLIPTTSFLLHVNTAHPSITGFFYIRLHLHCSTHAVA